MTEPSFTLVSFGADGALRDDGTQPVERLAARLGGPGRPYTDVFVFSHGWLNDRSTATAAYQDWIRLMAEYHRVGGDGIERRRPGFPPLLVGVHWPSAPWERPGQLRSAEARVAFYTELIGDPAAADELEPLLRRDDADELSPADARRLLRLDELAANRNGRVGAPPGEDRDTFDPEQIFRDARRPWWRAAIGSTVARSLLAPLWVSSFWRMKRRALLVGGAGVRAMLGRLQRAAGPDVRFHLIGHSFGAIVCAAAVQGPDGDPPIDPVHSLVLVQGALSLWSFAARIPDVRGTGHFHPIVERNLVRGPLVTTQSVYDRALLWFYRVAATVRGSVMLAPPVTRRLPRYGAVGCYGLGGLAYGPVALTAAAGQLQYPITAGRCYTVQCNEVLVGRGLSLQGAHSNLVRPELAGLVWSAALSPES